jgi:hypothetical protein
MTGEMFCGLRNRKKERRGSIHDYFMYFKINYMQKYKNVHLLSENHIFQRLSVPDESHNFGPKSVIIRTIRNGWQVCSWYQQYQSTILFILDHKEPEIQVISQNMVEFKGEYGCI